MKPPYCSVPECHNPHTNSYITVGDTVYVNGGCTFSANSRTPIVYYGLLCASHAMIKFGIAITHPTWA